MIRRVPQPGHFGVPSLSGREQVGQLKTCASASPIAELRRFVRSLAGQPAARRTLETSSATECGRRAAPMHPTRWSRDPAGRSVAAERADRRTRPASLMRLSIDKTVFPASVPRTWTPSTPCPLPSTAAGYRLTEPRARGHAPDRRPDGPLLGGRPRARGPGPPPGDRSGDHLPDAGRPLRARGGRADRPAERRARLRRLCADPSPPRGLLALRPHRPRSRMPGSGPWSARSTRRTGFRVDEHRLELFGLCSACQAATAG